MLRLAWSTMVQPQPAILLGPVRRQQPGLARQLGDQGARTDTHHLRDAHVADADLADQLSDLLAEPNAPLRGVGLRTELGADDPGDLLDRMTIAVAGRKLHPTVDARGITRKCRMDEARRLERLADLQ